MHPILSLINVVYLRGPFLDPFYLIYIYKLERFLRKNILAVYFLQNLAIHFNNYYSLD